MLFCPRQFRDGLVLSNHTRLQYKTKDCSVRAPQRLSTCVLCKPRQCSEIEGMSGNSDSNTWPFLSEIRRYSLDATCIIQRHTEAVVFRRALSITHRPSLVTCGLV